MSATELAPLAASMRAATFEKGDLLLREDEPPRAFHMLLTGAVTMRRHGRHLRTITAPGGVGFLSLLARTSGGTDAVAESRTETFELRADAIDEMFEDHFPIVLGTIRWLAERLIAENMIQAPPEYVPAKDGWEHLIGERELGIVERIFLLRRSLPFQNANVNSMARLARQMKERRLPPGQVVWRPGDVADGTLFIAKGRLELTWNEGRTKQIVGPGFVVGGAEALAGLPRWNDMKTIDEVILMYGSREAVIDMFEDDVEVTLRFVSMLATFLLERWDRRAEEAETAA